MGLELLYDKIELPKVFKVRRHFDDTHIEDIHGAVLKTMNESGIAAKLKKGGSVAVGVGSRGITNLPEIVKACIDWFKNQGVHPFIFPSMGSHGGATNEGQIEVLRHLAITEKAMCCPIKSNMDAKVVGMYKTGVSPDLPVYFDPNACEADSIFFVARVKPHTSFTGPHESGFCKMLTIGCGKQKGAEATHKLGYDYFPDVMPAMAQVALDNLPQIIGAMAVVENAYHNTCVLECVPREKMMERDEALLRHAKAVMPDLPLHQLHTLVVDYMGKNISGPGMDTNITGRFLTKRTSDVCVNGLTVLDLTADSNGNANGMGAADYIPRRLYNHINFEVTYLNGLTDPKVKNNVSTPPLMPHDLASIKMTVRKGNPFDEPVLLARIKDTLTMDKLFVSEALWEKIKDDPSYTLLSGPEEIKFDSDGNLADFGTAWDNF